MLQYYILNKPHGVICQFSPEGTHTTLKDITDINEDIYPVGRLDTDSEGLLVLTNDKRLNHQLLTPDSKTPKTYWVQVEGIPEEDELKMLRRGVNFMAKGRKYKSSPCQAKLVEDVQIWERNPPIRERKNIPSSWLSITISEGKNRQVRKMTAAIGYPTLRLVRVQLGALNILDQKIPLGTCVEYKQQELLQLLDL